MTVTVILNPRARGGLAAREAPAVLDRLRALFGAIDTRETRQSGHATDLARAALTEGSRTLIAIGGDGTASEVANGFLTPDGGVTDADVALGFVPIGTGGDWCRSLGVEGTARAVLDRMAAGASRRIDLGHVRFTDDHGVAASRLFVNIASFGLSGPVDRAVNRVKASRFLSGRAVFKAATLMALARYRFQPVAIRVDGGAPRMMTIAVVAVANGGYFGGGMWVAPPARIDDGHFDIVIVRGHSKRKLARALHRVYSGTHMEDEDTSHVVGRRIDVEPLTDPATDPVFLDIDGESPGRLPARFEILPKALKVLI